MMTIRKYVLAFFLAVIGSATMHTIHENVDRMYSHSNANVEIETIENIDMKPIVSSVIVKPLLEVKGLKRIN